MRIAILAVPGVQMLDVAGPMDVFMQANSVLDDANAYVVELIAIEPGPIRALNGIALTPTASIHDARDGYDTLLVAGSPGIRDHEANRAALDWIVDQSRRVRRLGAICTGAFLLAHAGLLDGRRATTHWNSIDRLAQSFSRVRVEPNKIFVRDGSVYTSAGVTATMDLALAMVEEDHGRRVALRVAEELILFLQRPGGQPQLSLQLAAQVADSGPIRDTFEWVLGNLGADLSVDALAERVGMSSRHFARLFKRETGQTPGEYVEAARFEEARRLLEENRASLKQIAAHCGFRDQAGLRRTFLRRIQVMPAEYRSRSKPPEPLIARRG